MSNKVLKPKKCSLCQFSQTYANNPMKCVDFFFSMKWPTGFSCDCCNSHDYYTIKCVWKTKISYVIECKNCHKQYSLLAGIVFQRCKLDFYKLLLGIFLFFNENKGISVIDLCSYHDVNYKTALLLETKCKILMSISNSHKLIESQFYEADVFNISSKSKNKAGHANEQQSVLGILSTNKENKYPLYMILRLIKDYAGESFKTDIEKYYILSKNAILNTDGKKVLIY